jgi:hypothetical protein
MKLLFALWPFPVGSHPDPHLGERARRRDVPGSVAASRGTRTGTVTGGAGLRHCWGCWAQSVGGRTHSFPWRLRHAGFLAAHAGLLVLLAGSILTLRGGIEGRVSLRKGEPVDKLVLSDGSRITVVRPSAQGSLSSQFSFRPGPVGWAATAAGLRRGERLQLEGAQIRAARSREHRDRTRVPKGRP